MIAGLVCHIMFDSKNTYVNRPKPDDLVYIFDGQQIFLTQDGKIPCFDELQLTEHQSFYCFAKTGGTQHLLLNQPIPNQTNLQSTLLKVAWLDFTEQQRALSSLAIHLSYWRQTQQYCGQCGNKLIDMNEERARRCEQCGRIIYPKICPCIIVMIRKDDELLLARGKRFTGSFYSALAGFIEPGETAEQAVHREVAEEVGINIKNIQYIMSQAWPFPDSLMLGFIADYASGNINIDKREIVDARWFKKNDLPERPVSTSIAHALIEHCINN